MVSLIRRAFARNWVHRPPPDEKDKLLDMFRSSSALKLLELNDRYKIIKPGLRVLDLGAAPGGWAQVATKACQSTSEDPQVFCVDLKSMIFIEGATSLVADVSEEEIQNQIIEFVKMPVDVVLSDLSKFTTKDRDIDCEQQWSFCLDTLRIANLILKTGGTALIKMYLGMEEPRYFETMKEYFKDIERVKSTKSHNVEVYYLAKGWKLGEARDEDITKEQLKEATEQIYSLGYKSKKNSVDADLEAKIRSEIGEFDKNNPKYEFLRDDEESLKYSSLTGGNPSFNTEIPTGLNDLANVVKKLKDEKHEPAEYFDEEEEQIDFNKKLREDIEETLKNFEESNFYTEDDTREEFKQFQQFQHEDFMKDKTGPNMEGAFKEMKEKIYSDMKRAKNNPTRSFEDWKNAEKDTEFWNN